MPDTFTLGLTAGEIAARQLATRDAIASARVEGGEVSPEAQSILGLADEGRIGEDEVTARIRRLHAET